MSADEIARRAVARMQSPPDYKAAIVRLDGETNDDYNARMIALAEQSGGRVGLVIFQQIPARSAPPMEGATPDLGGQPSELVNIKKEPLEVQSRWVVPFIV